VARARTARYYDGYDLLQYGVHRVRAKLQESIAAYYYSLVVLNPSYNLLHVAEQKMTKRTEAHWSENSVIESVERMCCIVQQFYAVNFDFWSVRWKSEEVRVGERGENEDMPRSK